MIDMVRRHEIQALRRAGHSRAETAKLVGVSQNSVQRVEAEAPVVSFDAAVPLQSPQHWSNARSDLPVRSPSVGSWSGGSAS